jgi:DNA-binding XRE family transcriptional regulator
MDKELEQFLQDYHNGTLAKDHVAGDATRQQAVEVLMQFIIARKNAGLTQADLAAIVGMSQSSLARIEAGRVSPSLATLTKLATALQVRVTLQ